MRQPQCQPATAAPAPQPQSRSQRPTPWAQDHDDGSASSASQRAGKRWNRSPTWVTCARPVIRALTSASASFSSAPFWWWPKVSPSAASRRNPSSSSGIAPSALRNPPSSASPEASVPPKAAARESGPSKTKTVNGRPEGSAMRYGRWVGTRCPETSAQAVLPGGRIRSTCSGATIVNASPKSAAASNDAMSTAVSGNHSPAAGRPKRTRKSARPQASWSRFSRGSASGMIGWP